MIDPTARGPDDGRLGRTWRQTTDPLPVLRDVERLAVLERARLLDTDAEPAFDRLTALAARLLDAPVALVTLVDDERQFFKSCIGLPEPWASSRQTPLTHSFCQYSVATNEPLVIADARQDPVLQHNEAIVDLGVVAYAGVPIRIRSEPLGSFCVIDSEPRDWTDRDLAVLEELGAAVGDLVDLRIGDLAGRERQHVLAYMVEAQEAERARIATEIHDDPLQVITAISIRLQLMRRHVDETQTALLDTLVENVQEVSGKLRRLLFDLRPSGLDEYGLGEAVRAYLSEFSADDCPVWTVRDLALDVDIPPAMRLVLFRIAQQAIANSVSHARATQLEILLEPDEGGIVLLVTDDGVGFDAREATPQPGHLGLITMRERTEVAGGRFRATSAPGCGTSVRAWLPLPQN